MARGNSTFNISLKLLDQNFKKGIANIQRQMKGLGNFIKGAFAIGSITAFGKQMIQVATDFEDAMARVRAVSNASADDLAMMTKEAQKLGATTRYTATEAANALENLTRNGMSASQATTALSGTLQLAQANAIGLAEAADIVSNTLNMFGLSAKETTRVNDVLSSVASTTATNVSEIYSALVNAAPAATALNISLEETASAIGALAQRGVKAEAAGTALRTALTKMVDPKIVDKMKEMGVNIDENVIKAEGLTGAVKRLGDANLSAAQLVTIFSQRGAVGIQQLIGAYEELELEMEITKASAGTTARMFQQGVGTTRAAIDTLKSSYEAFLLSLGQKSNAVFNGVLNLLTGLVKNFNTLGGTLLNIASVVVPLLLKRFTTMMTTFKAEMAKGVAAAAAFKTAIGGWVTIIGTAATWLVTGLVASMSKVNQEIKEIKKEMAETEVKTNDLENKAKSLIATLGPGTDTKTLAGAIKTLTTMFPDFKQEIMDAAAEAGKTKNYEKLRNVLNDIVGLQILMKKNKLMDALLQKQTEKVSERLKNGQIGRYQSGIYTYEFESKLDKALRDQIKHAKHLGGREAEAYLATLYEGLGEIFVTAANQYDAASLAQQFLSDILDVTDREVQRMIGGVAVDVLNDPATKAARETYKKSVEGLAKESELQTQTLNNLRTTTTESTEDVADNLTTGGKKVKDEGDKFAKSIDDIRNEFNKSIRKVNEDAALGINGVETMGDVAKKVYEIWLKAYNDFASLTGLSAFTGVTSNPYFIGMMNAKSKAENPSGLGNIRQSAEFKELLKQANQVTNTGKPKGPQGLKMDRYPAAPELDDYVIYTDDAITATSILTSSLSSLQSAFQTLADSDASWIDRLSAAQRVLETIEDTILNSVRLINELGDAELLAAKKEELATALGLKTKKKDVAANTAKAATGAASSQASIPYVGPILAIAAVATILAALAAATPKFAKGGIIQGSSKYGDKLLARVNAGEAILNQRQQKRLLDIADGKGGYGAGNVQFYISGKDLVGVLRNNNAANSKIAGAKGL